jgi:hypothetical protein
VNPAQWSRLNKEQHPERWCSDSKCLWNVARSGPCPKHGAKQQGKETPASRG